MSSGLGASSLAWHAHSSSSSSSSLACLPGQRNLSFIPALVHNHTTGISINHKSYTSSRLCSSSIGQQPLKGLGLHATSACKGLHCRQPRWTALSPRHAAFHSQNQRRIEQPCRTHACASAHPLPPPYRPSPVQLFWDWLARPPKQRKRDEVHGVHSGKVEVLRKGLLTLSVLVVIRLLRAVPVPGFMTYLERAVPQAPEEWYREMFRLDLATAFMPLNFMQLGIAPMFVSSLILQFLLMVPSHDLRSLPFFKSFASLANEDSVTMMRKLKQVRNVVAFIMAFSAVRSAREFMRKQSPWAYAVSTLWLLAGHTLLMELCELITDHGLGRGESLMISLSVIAALKNIGTVFQTWRTSSLLYGSLKVGAVVASIVVTLFGAIMATSAQRRLPMEYYTMPKDRHGSEPTGYIPFTLAAGGMSTIIYAGMCTALPIQLAHYLELDAMRPLVRWLSPELPSPPGSVPGLHYVLYFVLLFAFNQLGHGGKARSAATMSSFLHRIEARIPNVRPGLETVTYMAVQQRDTLLRGGVLMGLVGTFALATEYALAGFLNVHFSLSSLLILTSSFLHLKRQVAAYDRAPKLEAYFRQYVL